MSQSDLETDEAHDQDEGPALPSAERLQKLLARAGFGSRRKCEELIVNGRVTVDGSVVKELGAKADLQSQRVTVDGKPIHAEERVYYLLNKPKGVLCTVDDPMGRRTVLAFFPEESRRVFPVGRLDQDSRGAVIITNDGALTQLLTHPRYGVERTYAVRVRGEVDDYALNRLRQGIQLSEGRTGPARVVVTTRREGNTELEITIREGWNRQVRRMFAAVDHKVLGLTRIRIGVLELKGLASGEARRLSRKEVEGLIRQAQSNEAPPPPRRSRVEGPAKRHGKPDPRVAHQEFLAREARQAEWRDELSGNKPGAESDSEAFTPQRSSTENRKPQDSWRDKPSGTHSDRQGRGPKRDGGFRRREDRPGAGWEGEDRKPRRDRGDWQGGRNSGGERRGDGPREGRPARDRRDGGDRPQGGDRRGGDRRERPEGGDRREWRGKPANGERRERGEWRQDKPRGDRSGPPGGRDRRGDSVSSEGRGERKWEPRGDDSKPRSGGGGRGGWSGGRDSRGSGGSGFGRGPGGGHKSSGKGPWSGGGKPGGGKPGGKFGGGKFGGSGSGRSEGGAGWKGPQAASERFGLLTRWRRSQG
jgi:23S rRNA pseudouridine2605 synthase